MSLGIKKPRITAILVALLGLPGIILGVQLVLAGGTFYYALSG